jgi:phosphoesterase RecJ-like protein
MSIATKATTDPTMREQVASLLRSHRRFLITTHEGPDGDALGSLLGMHHLLTALGKDSVMFVAAKEFPLPIEYRFMPLAEVFHEPPVDISDRAMIFVDCGNRDRASSAILGHSDAPSINIDHHHDNTHFADLNLVEPEASCTAEIVYELAQMLGVEITSELASVLYVGIVTDTGKFMYNNTSARTHRIAAELIEAGVDVDDTHRRLYEHVPIEKLRLVARAMNGIRMACDGRLAMAYITEEDYRETGADEGMTEGIIDHLRSIEGAQMAVMVRDLGDRRRAARKVSLRATGSEVDVSAIARLHGGGGHVRAAGFSTDLEFDELAEMVAAELLKQLDS